MVQRWLLIVVLLVGVLAWAGCDDGDNGGDSGSGDAARPDLQFSSFAVYPGTPTAGQQFTLQVQVANSGQAASGEYDVALSIHDVDRDSTYPVGTFRQGPMQPGEDYTVYNDDQRLVNEPGTYEVRAEIVPFEFEDSNPGNNAQTWRFTVQ